MGPLDGVRIVELDALGPVPLAATILADLGADIIRIVRAGGQAAYEDVGGAVLHRSRPYVELDLKSSEDRDTALQLIASADALLEGFRPGVMERLGLGPDLCAKRNARLVYCRMTGWGQTGPLAPRAGHDINYIALSGALGMIGDADRPPPPPLNLVGDYGGGAMFLALGALAGILSARQTGLGQVVDAAMVDGTAMLLSLFTALSQGYDWTTERADNLLDGGAPFYRTYSCSDGGHVAVGALEPQFFTALLAGLGIPADSVTQYDRASWPALRQRLADVFLTRARDEWAAVFEGTDACVTPVLTLPEAFDNLHHRARKTYDEIAGLRQPAPAPRFSATPGRIGASESLDPAQALARWRT
jgi:alpha-methylacyl-CoA racemase